MSDRLPQLRRRRSPSSGRLLAYAKFNGRTVSFGPFGPDAKRRFDAFLADWLANGRQAPASHDQDGAPVVADLVARYLEHAEQHYLMPDGSPSREIENLRRALAPLLESAGEVPADGFQVANLEQVQRTLADRGLARTTIRARINAIRRMFRWCESRRLVPPGTWEHLRALEHLRPGRTRARETKPVEAVGWAHVQAVLPHLSSPLRAAVLVQWHAGLRPGEVLTITRRQIDMGGRVWIYRPTQHKGVWRGRERIIRLGPKAQEALRPLLRLDPDAPLISPRDAVAELREQKRASRKTRVQPSQLRRAQAAAARPKAIISDRYTVKVYRRAIDRACIAAEIPSWSPNQLRHACAARLFGMGQVEAARAVLGHSRLDMTRHYAATADARLAEDAMLQHG